MPPPPPPSTGLLFVTAVYDLYRDSGATPQGSGSKEIVERLLLLQRHLPADLFVFCQPELLPELAEVAAATTSASAARVVPLALADTETARLLEGATGLPSCRSETKDTKLYHCLMCAKTEFLRLAQRAEPARSGFVWIDAGITKILQDPEALPGTLAGAAAQAEEVARALPDRIVLPGCWTPPQHWGEAADHWPFFKDAPCPWPSADRSDPPVERFAMSVIWRFCGGFAIVPSGLVERFAAAVLAGAARILAATGCSVWEVNVWALVERELPVTWYHGNHDASIFDCRKALF
jgi:uncharacterized membrane protein YphA (DoxX/SURF4 family)